MGVIAELGSSRRRLVVGLVLIALFIVALFIWQAFSASRALLDARDRAEIVKELISDGDFDGASRALAQLQENTHDARNQTDGFLWDLGRKIPYLGRNVGAVQTVSEVLDTATRINAPIALQLSRAVDGGTFRPVAGKIDLPEIERLTPDVRRAASSIEQAARDLDEIRPGQLTFPFNDLVADLQEQVGDARSAASATATAFDLLPDMLGKSGARTYLLMVQNPAELRSSGGLPGSLAILHAKDGALRMGWQGSATDINPFTGPVLELPKDTVGQYGANMAADFRDINFTPDFAESAQIARAMVKQKLDVDVDGVVSVDPIALGYVMQGTGPVSVANGVSLTAASLAPTLLNQVYLRIQDPVGQDDFFEGAARRVFDAVMGGRGDQQKAIKGLATAANEHRLLLWAADDTEQARLVGTAVGGVLAGDTGDVPQVGMYLNDTVAGKMDYYLRYRTSVSAVDCRQKGAQDLRASMAVESTMPENFKGLGPYVLGTGEYAPQGTIAFNLRIYAPVGGRITALTIDGQPRSITSDLHRGRPVAFVPVSLEPGQQSMIIAEIRTATGQDGDGVFSFTPGMVPARNGVKIASACD